MSIDAEGQCFTGFHNFCHLFLEIFYRKGKLF